MELWDDVTVRKALCKKYSIAELSEKLERFKKMMGEKKKEESPKENKEEAKEK